MKKLALILMIVMVLTTSCGVKEGFTTFGALQNKIDDYLINVDITDAKENIIQVDSTEFGQGIIKGYATEGTTIYIQADLLKENSLRRYEVFYIDDSLTYVVEIISDVELGPESLVSSIDELENISDTLVEYIFLDNKPAIFNVEDSVLSDLDEENKLISYIIYIEESLNQ